MEINKIKSIRHICDIQVVYNLGNSQNGRTNNEDAETHTSEQRMTVCFRGVKWTSSCLFGNSMRELKET
jgi:hypothetical protein